MRAPALGSLEGRPADHRVTQIADHEVMRFGFAKFGEFQIDPAHPEAFLAKALDQVAADKTACTADQGFFLTHHAFSKRT